MKTVPTILPIYDSVEKQDQNRTGTKMPILTPRFKLPSLLWNVQSDNPGEIDKIELVGTSGENLELASSIDNIFASAYDTLTTSGSAITSAINLAGNAYAVINPVFSCGINEVITIRFTLTLTSGALPYFFLYDGSSLSIHFVQANAGYNEIRVISNASSSNTRVVIYSHAAANFSTDAISVKKNDITSYFNTSPAYIQTGGGSGWLNNATAYDVFTSVDKSITSAIKTTAAGVASCWNVVAAGSVSTTITAGESIRIKAVLTLNSGTAPKCVLQRTDTSANISNVVTLSAGTNYFFLTATSTITGFAIAFYNANLELTNYSLVLSLGEKSVIPRLYTPLTDDYFQYKGNTLGLLLPLGSYYLKITTLNNAIYYSDWFVVSEIYDKLITSLSNVDYDTLIANGTTITNIKNAAGGASTTSQSFYVSKNEKIRFIFNFTLIAGELPAVYIYYDGTYYTGAGCIQGLNDIEVTAPAGLNYNYRFFNSNGSEFSTTEILVIREFSPNFIKINFNDTHDLGEILYQDGLTQEVYFEQKLAPPTHEVVEVGEEKNGIFVAEKIITKYKYRIIANVGRELYKALIRLPQHDTISITDEVGNVYTPKVGNVQVIPANWIYYDVCRLEIIFNDNTEYVWTSENNNIT